MLRRLMVLLLGVNLGAAAAAGLPKAAPHLDSRGQAAYQSFLSAATPRAFAIAPGGAHAWAAEAVSEEAAEEQALEDCRRHSEQPCVLFAVNAQAVFDGKRWATLWGPYPDAAASARAAVGMKRGMRFPDLALSDAAGKKLRLGDLGGRVLVLHFWGSWCPHCRQEMPGLQRLARQLGKEKITFALVQVREDAASARAWLRQQKIAMPLYDSGVRNARESALPLAGGGMLADREIARAFPSTYVLGRHGVVLFSHTGPTSDWSQYAEFLRHAARP
ncbi:MAG: TlpA disulfide reductase family protein [Pseudomonadota bacterium]|nr:TlpA disulfide reductase family protein [Pseudomonadota bacterium]